MRKFHENVVNNPVNIFHNFSIGHSQYTNLFLILKPVFSLLISFGFFHMDVPIHLDCQLGLHAIEIEYKFSHRCLPAKMMTQRVATQVRP